MRLGKERPALDESTFRAGRPALATIVRSGVAGLAESPPELGGCLLLTDIRLTQFGRAFSDSDGSLSG